MPHEECDSCELKADIKEIEGAKYLPLHYTSNQERRGNERAANERNGNGSN